MSGVDIRTAGIERTLHRHRGSEVAGGPGPVLAGLQILDIFGDGIRLLPLTVRHLAPHDNSLIFFTIALPLRHPRVEGPTVGALWSDVMAVRAHRVMGPCVLDDGELRGGFILLPFKVEMEEGSVACDEDGLI